MIYRKIQVQWPLRIRNRLLVEYREIPVLFMASEPFLEHLHVRFIDADDAGLLDGDIEREGLVVVIEVNRPHLPDGIGIGQVLIGKDGVIVLPPFHDLLVQDHPSIMLLELPEFHGLLAGKDFFGILPAYGQAQPVQGLWSGAVRVFSLELGEAFLGRDDSA